MHESVCLSKPALHPPLLKDKSAEIRSTTASLGSEKHEGSQTLVVYMCSFACGR